MFEVCIWVIWPVGTTDHFTVKSVIAREVAIYSISSSGWDCVLYPLIVNRYFLSTNEKDEDLREGDGWLVTDLSDNPFISFMGPRPQRELTPVNRYFCQKLNISVKYDFEILLFLIDSIKPLLFYTVPLWFWKGRND